MQVRQTHGLLFDLQTLQHQEDGDPWGNPRESTAPLTLELRWGHSIGSREAADGVRHRGGQAADNGSPINTN